MKRLHELSQIGRGRRLRPAAKKLLADYGIVPTTLKQITEASNTIFQVLSSTGDGFTLRMTAPKSCHGAGEIRSEVAWLHALDQDTDIGIPAPIARQDGTYVSEVPIPGEHDPICCALYRWVPGKMLDDVLTSENMRRLGILMARLHEHAASFSPPDEFHIRTFDRVFPYSVEGFAGIEPVVLWHEESPVPLTEDQLAIYEQARQLVADEIEQLMRRSEKLIVIHNDLHMWNVKVHRDKLYALDFEDMMWGRPIQDIATTLYYFRWRDTYETLLAAFRNGYESVLVWPQEHQEQLDTLIMGRMLMLANYVVTSEDSEDRAFAPEYLSRVEQRLRAHFNARP